MCLLFVRLLANLPAEKLAELKAAGERVMRGEL